MRAWKARVVMGMKREPEIIPMERQFQHAYASDFATYFIVIEFMPKQIETSRRASTSYHRLPLPVAGCHCLPHPPNSFRGWVAMRDG